MESKFQCEKCGKEYALQEAVVCCDNCFPKWQPIETAPKDGRYIIIYGGYSGRTVTMARWQEMQRKNSRWQISSGHPVPRDPTHWMPLPQAPEE